MDLAPFVPWLSVIALLISVGTSITTLLTSGAKANSTKLADHDRRIQKLENDLQHTPDKDGLHRVELTVKDIQAQIASMAASAQATERTARRVEDFLIEQAKRG